LLSLLASLPHRGAPPYGNPIFRSGEVCRHSKINSAQRIPLRGNPTALNARQARASVFPLIGLAILILPGQWATGCSAQPDPVLQLIQQSLAEKNQAAAECSQQINSFAEFYGKNEDIIGEEAKALGICTAGKNGSSNQPDLSQCLSQIQRGTHAMAELSGRSEPVCATDIK
jgi:hypothetical protein